MTPNVHPYSARLRNKPGMAALHGCGYVVDARGMRELRRMYRLVRRHTGDATAARLQVLSLLNIGASSTLLLCVEAVAA